MERTDYSAAARSTLNKLAILRHCQLQAPERGGGAAGSIRAISARSVDRPRRSFWIGWPWRRQDWVFPRDVLGTSIRLLRARMVWGECVAGFRHPLRPRSLECHPLWDAGV